MHFPIGGERVTCRGSKLTNSLITKLSKDSHVIRSCTLKPLQICCAKRRQANNYIAVFLSELGGITKNLMRGPREALRVGGHKTLPLKVVGGGGGRGGGGGEE